ncbi:helix-turn-helix domain-containing protein [Brevibacillus nitrificans]|uniref:Helix-turn-helix domain-containing protein n=1 Tax=Brevibacillus nitrificans TaxID=651560 RepID=A0A3M8DJQ5_9BACL|nr:helix-turn-helix domain-containing protein [Brevibacillus nitrificans]RNB88283.1 helix-turn-helix domain-containing protein [Brevibacillus nitrificans]
MLDQQMFPLEQIDIVKFRPSDLSEKRTFDCHAILVTIGGKGEWRIGEKRYALDQSGKVFFCNPGTELLYTSSDTQQGCSFYQLSFRAYEKTGREGEWVFVQKHGELLPAGEIGSAPYHRIRELADSLHLGKQESTPADAFRIQMLFQEMLHLLWKGQEEAKLDRSESMIEKITAYIEEHYDEDLNRDQLANMAGISQEYFSRLFKTKTGTNFSKYLSELRIKKAQEYLLTSKSSLREIAQSVGYRDEFYLSHKFKQVTGDSPSLYMKRPKRIASVSANYTGCLLALGVTPIIAKINPFIQRHFRSQLEGADVQTVDLLTFHYNKLIAKASPDLVLCYDSYEDLSELRRIAPTVAISLSSLSWRDQFMLIAELVNAVGKANDWLGRFDEKIAQAKRLLEQTIDTTETVGIFEIWKDKIMVFDDSFGRAGQVLYQALRLPPSQRIRDEVFTGQRYKIIPLEELPLYATDRMFVTIFQGKGGDEYAAKVMASDVWKSLPAYRNKRIYINDHDTFYNWDPVSTEYQLVKVMEQLTG